MNNLTLVVVDRFSSLRSIALICLALIATHVFYRLSTPVPVRHLPVEPRHCDKLPGSLSNASLEWVTGQAADSLPVGAHLISPRRFYMHHGIHLGGGDVAHYSGFSGSLKSGPIEVTDLAHFGNGKPVWMFQEPGGYRRDEVVARARSRVGEDRYSVLFNNCEHFCRWCISGKSYSTQVDAYFHRPRDLFALIAALQPQLIA